MTPNDTANVTVARGVAGGYLLSAPTPADVAGLLETLSDLSAPLPRGFENLGYVSADGVAEAESVTTETVLDVDGQPIESIRTGRTETVRFRLVEMRAAALAEAHGHANVVAGETQLTAHHNNAQRGHRTYVAELVLKDGRRWRKVVPDGQVTDVAELALSSTQLVGRELTVSCNARQWVLDGVPYRDTVIDFVEQPLPDVTVPTSARLASLLSNVPISPPFAPWVTEYSLVTHVRGLMLRAHALDPSATIDARTEDMVRPDMRDGQDCYVDTYEAGEHELRIIVVNQESGESATYALSIRYEPEDSGDARLAYVRMYGHTLEPMFDPDVRVYSTTISSRYASVSYVPADSTTTVQTSLNGGTPTAGHPGASQQFNWVEGDNTLVLTCTRGSETISYTLRVTYVV